MSGGWKDSNRRARLPSNWAQICAAVRQRSGGKCEVRRASKGGVPCGRPADGGVDHIIPNDDDSLANLQDTCLTPESPVLMADGTQRSIAAVQIGDAVIGHDGLSHRVIATHRRWVETDLAVVAGVRMTTDHHILTPRGWSPASEHLAGVDVWVPHPQVLVLRRAEDQVLRGVVAADAVQVVHPLDRGEGPSDHLLHDVAVLHDVPTIDEDPHVAGWAHLALQPLDRDSRPRARVELSHPAPLRAEPCPGCAGEDNLERLAAVRALHLVMRGLRRALPGPLALLRAGRVVRDHGPRGQEASPADRTDPFGEDGTFPGARWYPLREVGLVPYSGYVHDITVADSHSYIAGGFAVHNCRWHHQKKSSEEGQAAKAVKKDYGKLPAEPHPGMRRRT